MNIFVYSDESGVFDKVHNDYFVFGGLIFLSKEQKDICSRKYIKAENDIRKSLSFSRDVELKASNLENKYKAKLYRSLNQCYKFGVIVDEKRVHNEIYSDKKSKQRYLDYVYKISVKRLLENLIRNKIIPADDVERMYFFVDEHTTATNGVYDLHETLEEEFKRGMFNQSYNKFYPPLFPAMSAVELKFCNSQSTTLVRAADIVANKIFFFARQGNVPAWGENNLFVIKQP